MKKYLYFLIIYLSKGFFGWVNKDYEKNIDNQYYTDNEPTFKNPEQNGYSQNGYVVLGTFFLIIIIIIFINMLSPQEKLDSFLKEDIIVFTPSQPSLLTETRLEDPKEAIDLNPNIQQIQNLVKAIQIFSPYEELNKYGKHTLNIEKGETDHEFVIKFSKNTYYKEVEYLSFRNNGIFLFLPYKINTINNYYEDKYDNKIKKAIDKIVNQLENRSIINIIYYSDQSQDQLENINTLLKNLFNLTQKQDKKI
jgi:hypothetical protein